VEVIRPHNSGVKAKSFCLFILWSQIQTTCFADGLTPLTPAVGDLFAISLWNNCCSSQKHTLKRALPGYFILREAGLICKASPEHEDR